LPIACLETIVSSAEQRAVRNGEESVVARVADIYAALPAITGKLELEYEGELKGAEHIARELVRGAAGRVFSRYLADANLQNVIQWFEMGGELKVADTSSSDDLVRQLRKIQGLLEHVDKLGVGGKDGAPLVAAAGEFILEGLWAQKRISRSEQRGFFAERPKAPDPREPNTRPPRRQFN
jgi:magnesium chelatase subunit I